MSFRLLGPVAALEDDSPVDLGGAKRVALLAGLLVRANRVCSSDYLIDVLWGDEPPAAARATLQSHVAHLRRHLGASLRSQPGGYLLDVPAESIDAHRFEQLLDAARAGVAADAHAQALADAEEALSLWHGSALEGLSDRSFAAAAAARLEELRWDAVEVRLEAMTGLGRHAAVAADAEHALAAEPWREGLWELLALALYRDGRQAAALAALRRARTLLLDQLGVDPSPGLIELESRILNQDADLLVAVPASAEPAAVPGAAALPSVLTSFVGRVEERQAIADAVKQFRLVTVLGRGGVGKTRLAIVVAGDVSASFPDGVWFVDLVAVSDTARVVAAVAARLGVSERDGLPLDDAVIEGLRGRRALIVLDNCEHLIAGIPPVVERLLAACSGVSVLATSRSRLLVPFEHVVVVEGLDVDDDGDAVALFETRAISTGASLAEGATRPRIAALCRALDGTPLAIELAAARLSALGVDGLEAGLADQLRVLSGRRGATDRHSSVRAALDWSWELLDEDERTLFRRVSVFVAPFGVEAAAGVADSAVRDVAERLARLSEQSLLVSTHGDGTTQYRMLETLRQYGKEQLAAADEVGDTRAAHATWYLDRAADVIASGGTSETELGWIADNLRASLRRAGTTGDQAYAIALGLGKLLFTHGALSEAQARFEQAAAATNFGAAAATALRDASGVAFCRIQGEDVVRLRREAALIDGTAPERSAYDLASAAMVVARHTGVFAQRPPEVLPDLLHLVAGLDTRSPQVRSLLASVETFRAAERGVGDVDSATLAVSLAQEADPDVVAESVALDALYSALMSIGDVTAAIESVRRRIGLLTEMPRNPTTAPELIDGLHMAAETSLASGDLHAAKTWALQFRDLPFMVEQEHVTTNRLMVIDALAGEWDEVLNGSERYRAAWEREDRPRGVILARGAAAVAMVHGMLGHDDAFAHWRSIAASHGLDLDPAAGFDRAWPAVFDGVRLLHLDRYDEAVERLSVDPAALTNALGATWRGWYAALWAEAAVLAGCPDASERLESAHTAALGNAVAASMVQRAEALLRGDDAAVLATAEPLAAAGCRYQSTRSLTLAKTT